MDDIVAAPQGDVSIGSGSHTLTLHNARLLVVAKGALSWSDHLSKVLFVIKLVKISLEFSLLFPALCTTGYTYSISGTSKKRSPNTDREGPGGQPEAMWEAPAGSRVGMVELGLGHRIIW